MKLLTPVEVKALQAEEERKKIIRSNELLDISEKSRESLNNIEAEFRETLDKNKKEWEEENKAHVEKRNALKAEIATLLKEKEEAMLPIEELKKKAEEEIRVLGELRNSLNKKENELNELKSVFLDKLENVEARTEEIKLREEELSLKVIRADEQEEIIASRKDELRKEIDNFLAQRQKASSELDKRETAIILREKSAEAAENSVKEKEKWIEEEKIRLADQRKTLELEIERVKKKAG